MATFTDDFNRSDSGASTGWGANWTNYRDGSVQNSLMEIFSNRARISATSFSWRIGAWNGGAVGADQYSEASLFASDKTDLVAGVLVRIAGDGNSFYFAGPNSATTLQMRKIVSGSSTTIGSGTYTHVDGDVYRLEVSGTTLNLYVNDVLQIGPITDSDLSSGQPGTGGFFAIAEIDVDDWGGGDLSSNDATVSPTTGALSVFGNSPLVNDFSAISLRGVLINEAGSPLANLTGISCLVWYGSAPAGAPDESLSSLTTNANGSYSFALALGGLAFGEQVYRVIYREDPPTANNSRVHSPNYE